MHESPHDELPVTLWYYLLQLLAAVALAAMMRALADIHASPAPSCHARSELRIAGGSTSGLSPQLRQMTGTAFDRFLAACLSDCIFADLGWAELRPFDV